MATIKSAPKKAVRPFLFEQSFDVATEAKETAAKQTEEEAPPTYSEEELQAARDEAYKAGMQTGLDQAGASIDQQISATLDVLAATLGRIGERQISMNEAIARDAVDLVVAVVKKLLPATVERNGVAEVTALLQQSLAHLLQEPRITIRVAEAVAENVNQQVGEVARRAGFDGKLTVLADPELGPADCRILWNDGEANRTLERALAQLADLVAGVPDVEPDVSAIAPHAPPLGSSAPIDVEISLEENLTPDAAGAALNEVSASAGAAGAGRGEVGSA